MSRIVALNEPKTREKPKEEICNFELQETLAENEYKRAIKLKMKGYFDNALSLLSELLETKVLNDIPTDKNSKKLWAIRFNCFKNVGFIYEEQKNDQEKAMENYMIALDIDKSDVYLSQRCAQLALKMGATEIAEHFFENCLKYNPNHWVAEDGLLKTLCKNNNLMGAYFQASKLFLKNKKNRLALKVLQELAYKYPHFLKIYNELYNPDGVKLADIPLDNYDQKTKSVFNEVVANTTETEEEPTVDLKEFQLKSLNWETIGKYVIALDKHIKQNKLCPFVMIKYEELYLEPDEEANDWNRPKKKKRISDVELLQQWHWWPKNKKSFRFDAPDDDSIFLKYYVQDECKVCRALKKSSNDFDSQTKTKFDNFVTTLKTTEFDLVRLNELWLQYISSLWSIPIPSELVNLFVEAFKIYHSQFNICSLNPIVDFVEFKNYFDIYLLIFINQKPS